MAKFAGGFLDRLSNLSPATREMFSFLPKEKQEDAAVDLLKAQAQGEMLSGLGRQQLTEKDYENIYKFREREAQAAQKIGLESLRESAKYGALFKTIPQSIANAFGAQAALQLAAAGNVANIYAQANPYRMDIQTPGYNFQPTKYYGSYTG